MAIIAGAGYYFYNQYEQNKKDEYELSYASKKSWKWHDEYDRIQISKLEGNNKSILRKVNLNKKYVIYAYKNDNYSLSGMVKFVTTCTPNKEIKTSEKFSNGDTKTLKCNEDGNELRYRVQWQGKDTDVTWEENLGGFSLRENFSYWDFDILDQEVTLSKAQ
jgi:hypothetical protein